MNIEKKIAKEFDNSKKFTIIYMVGLFGIFSSLKIDKFQISSLSIIAFPVLYIVTLVKFFKIANKNIIKKTIANIILIFGGFIITSMLSYNSYKSLTSTIFLIINFLFSVWIAETHSKAEFLYRTLQALTIILIAGFIILPFYPSFVIYNDPLDRSSFLGLPNFKGLFPHKIHAGIFSIIGFSISRYFYFITHKRIYIYISTLFSIGILASGSSLALAIFVTILIIVPLLQFIKNKFGSSGVYLSLILILSTSITLYFNGFTEYILESLGRDKGLTGRTSIWEFGINYISENPLIGSGFNTFFNEELKSPAQVLWRKQEYYQAPSFHNGYIELLAETGLVGSFPFLMIIIITFFSNINKKETIMLSILITYLIANTAAAMLIKQNSFFFIFISYLYLYRSNRSSSFITSTISKNSKRK